MAALLFPEQPVHLHRTKPANCVTEKAVNQGLHYGGLITAVVTACRKQLLYVMPVLGLH